MYSRHLAWLHAVPETKSDIRKSRLALMQDRQEEPAMPEVYFEYLVSYLLEIGPTVAAGAGEGPIPQTEIDAWQRNTGVDLDAWDVRTLRAMSNAYLSESHKATKVDAPPPYSIEPLPDHRERIMHKTKAFLRG